MAGLYMAMAALVATLCMAMAALVAGLCMAMVGRGCGAGPGAVLHVDCKLVVMGLPAWPGGQQATSTTVASWGKPKHRDPLG